MPPGRDLPNVRNIRSDLIWGWDSRQDRPPVSAPFLSAGVRRIVRILRRSWAAHIAEHRHDTQPFLLPLLDWSSVVRHRFYVCFVAECNNLYYATAIWSEPSAANRMKDGDKLMELRRLAIAPDAPKNTASRMLRVMKDKIAREYPQLLRLISYQDTEAHTGGIYKAAGWKNAAETEFRPWLHHRSTEELTQTRAKKVRWEYTLRESPNVPDDLLPLAFGTKACPLLYTLPHNPSAA